MKKLAMTLLIAFSLALPSAVFADSGGAASNAPLPFLSFQLNPALGFGGGSAIGSAAGGDLWLSANYRPPSFKVMFLSADLGLNFFGIESGTTSGDATLFTLGGGFGFGWRLLPKLDFSMYMKGGLGFPSTSVSDTKITEALVPGFAYSLGVNSSYLFSPAFALGLDVALRGAGSYYSEVAFALGITFNLYSAAQQPTSQKETPAAKPAPLENKPLEESKPAPVEEKKPVPRTGTGVELFQVELNSIFPIFSKYYDENAIGKGTLHNWEKLPVENIKVNLMVKGYMAEKKPCKAPSRLDPGEEQGVELFGLFTDDVLKITQGTKALANISVEYTLKGEKKANEFVETIRFHDRNAMTWDDDRKAAAFVTAKDTSVLVFSNNINSMVKGKMSRAVEKNLQTAIAFHDALRLYGISYVSNPLTPYSVVSKDKMAVDTLKFPRQTFEFKSGDCSDLSILYCALLESVQIETAFITIPGHIFMAFALKTDPKEAKSNFAQSLDDLIIRENKVWVPIEVTERDKACY